MSDASQRGSEPRKISGARLLSILVAIAVAASLAFVVVQVVRQTATFQHFYALTAIVCVGGMLLLNLRR